MFRKEEGRYKNNVLVCSTRRKGIMFVRSSKLRERIEASVESARRAADMAAQRVEITLSRTQTAQERAENAIQAAKRARDDADTARICAIQFDPTFQQPGNFLCPAHNSNFTHLKALSIFDKIEAVTVYSKIMLMPIMCPSSRQLAPTKPAHIIVF
jgi:hypothetical protein